MTQKLALNLTKGVYGDINYTVSVKAVTGAGSSPPTQDVHVQTSICGKLSEQECKQKAFQVHLCVSDIGCGEG